MVPRKVASSGYSTAPVAESDGDHKDPRGGPRTGLAEAGGEPKLDVASHTRQIRNLTVTEDAFIR